MLLDQIGQSEWKKALNHGLKTFNIKLFNIDKLSPKKVKEMYLHLVERYNLNLLRFYRTGR